MYKILNNDEDFLAVTTSNQNGYSKEPYKSLNFGFHVGDEPNDVRRNYEHLCDELGISYYDIYLPGQKHSANFVEVTKDSSKIIPDCDALYTKERNAYLGVLTADCLPIVLYCPDKEIVAAIHAGWLGSARLITHRVVHHLIEHEGVDPSLIKVFFGPSIFVSVYEVGQDVYDRICLVDSKNKDCFIIKSNQKYLFDNRLFNIKQLKELGIKSKNIDTLDVCTFSSPNYFSYRRNPITGRQLTMIGLK